MEHKAYHPKNTAKLYDTFAALRTDLAIGNASQNPRDNGIRRVMLLLISIITIGLILGMFQEI